jgi:hypothetical protein
MLSGQSAEIRESGRHGRFDLPERCGRLAQSKAALLPQTDLCKSKRELESTNQFLFCFVFLSSQSNPTTKQKFDPPDGPPNYPEFLQSISSVFPTAPNNDQILQK